MSKFKVGDKVRIKNMTSMSLPEKARLIGKEFIIEKLSPWRYWKYVLSGDASHYNWCDDELELVESKPFTKSDLKDGMVVERKDGARRIVLNGMLTYVNSWLKLEDYNDDLTFKGLKVTGPKEDWDIVKVYTSDGGSLKCWCRDKYLTLIWERKEEPKHKEMTVEEIEKELGYKIKVVGDSSCQK